MPKSTSQPPGPGVDAEGRAVIDPTANVIANLEAAVRRQDDLREMESSHLREVMTLRADYSEQLRKAETARIDAIRAVDVAAVQRAAEVAAEAVQALATQVPITAEAVRTALTAALDPILKDVQELRRIQYEQAGSKATQTEQKTDRGLNVAALGVLVGMFVGVSAIVIAIITH